MSRIVWGKPTDRTYEVGVDRGVFYPKVGPGVAWNGLVSVEETVSGGEVNSYYYDGVKYIDFVSSEDFQATIVAFSTPAEFSSAEGRAQLSPGLYASQQPRAHFGFSYRTMTADAAVGTAKGYKIHLVYNATATPSSVTNKTLDDSRSPDTKSWTIDTVPVPATTYRPTAHLVINSKELTSTQLTLVETALYGSASAAPQLPLPAVLVALLT